MTVEIRNIPPSQTAPTSEEEIDLNRIAGLIVDHKWTIIGVTALFATLGTLYALLATPIYQSDALVQVEKESPLTTPMLNVNSLLGDSLPQADGERRIMMSRHVLGQAVTDERLDVMIEPKLVPLIGGFLVRSEFTRPEFARGSSMVWAGEDVGIGHLDVDPVYQGEPFTLRVVDAQSYALSFEGRVLGIGVIDEPASFLDGKVNLTVDRIEAPTGAEFDITQSSVLVAVDDLRKRFSVAAEGQETGVMSLYLNDPDPERARRALSSIVQLYLAQNIERSSAQAAQSLEFLQQQIPKIRDQLDQAENALSQYRTQHGSIDLPLENQSILQRLVNVDSQITDLEFSEADISTRFQRNHPTYAALLQKKSQLQRERDALNRQINGLPDTQQQMLRMQRDVGVNQEVYVQLMNRMEEANIARASTVGNVRIIDDASVKPTPIAPKRALIVVISLLLGAIIGVVWVVLRGIFNRGVESAEEIEGLDLPVYTTVPASSEQAKLTRKVRSGKKDKLVSADLLARRFPGDQSIEALRNLRTSLHFAMLESRDKALMITGPSPDIGKSFVCMNLAAVCAQAGQRVLLIDADMRKGYLHHTFKLSGRPGLSELLSNTATQAEVIHPTGIEGLDLLPRGGLPPNPSELLMQPSLQLLLESAKDSYDLVIIDSPPVLAVTDAGIIGHQVGTTLLVARFQRNTRKEIDVARKRLINAGVSVKGVILNAVERKATTVYSYGHYEYRYG
ncbi:polysaccharide biosynthesis tyrosine autokinase [Halotalea alkalilenta]|uniref:polysaccharide biosynthesis tyrosine autokinase n=1 Tax=Halotalea alkalilenta TaxID=376489 RepID=UPI00069454BB|nr:polysaccharide biosynthesis tyrosine autokinase [Halotalea alkalilenta]